MKDRLWHWWPALPACLIIYFGGASFVEKYPHAGEHKASRAASGARPDSLLIYVRQAFHPGAAAAADSSPGNDNPFRPIQAVHQELKGPVAKVEPPPRHFVLKGTVGNNVATIANNAGLKQIVKVGDPIDSAEVVSIEADKVILKDRAGRFELIFRK